MEEKLRVGQIIRPHGIKGEVKVYPLTDDINRFKKLKKVYLDFKGELNPLEINGVKFFKNEVIISFKEFNNINEIEKYRKCDLWVDRIDAVPLSVDEYYIADLIGITVFDEDDKEFGTIKDIITTGANDVYIISSLNYGEVLVPAIKECILNVDIEEKTMKIHLLEGLI
ncbi:MAG: ribosome maturation factor RimM [Lachnospiraceae bacterium]|jgi:16S rRNA processing protein RimM|nr:ribosome maturation factor RimM [Lachnospiraceae bacterium]